MRENVLVVGGGGREHALAWKLSQDSAAPALFCAPGNAGTDGIAVNLPLEAEDLDGIVSWAETERPTLTVIGPEAPLCAGLADRLRERGLAVFGPGAEGARLEGSKIFAKRIMADAGVPTAHGAMFNEEGLALSYIHERNAPLVVKADGLAAGKGVAVCETPEEAERAVRAMLSERAFGEAGSRILIEDRLVGEEASILALTDGEQTVLLASSQDHKPIGDGDTGPNTGGMGAISPTPIVGDDLWPFIRAQIVDRTLYALRENGIAYRGVLYAGLMLTADGPKVLEFNCRFGDPETQAVLARWEGDLLPALKACAAGAGLSDELIGWSDRAAACVVMASGGYPGPYRKGLPIAGLERAGALDGVSVFHAGTKREGGNIVTAGGRVLGVTAVGGDMPSAIRRAYEAVDQIHFDGAQVRSDIGAKALRGASA
jgi:phosphoribosylamine---glycine ligase